MELLKRFKVYVIKDQNNKIIYVGQTYRSIETRFQEHVRGTTLNVNSNSTVHLHNSYDTKREALDEECLVKSLNGFECTERRNQFKEETQSIGGKANRSLDMETVTEIRNLYKAGIYTQRKLAEIYGFSSHIPILKMIQYKTYIEE